jgi:hypothetical protein
MDARVKSFVQAPAMKLPARKKSAIDPRETLLLLGLERRAGQKKKCLRGKSPVNLAGMRC